MTDYADTIKAGRSDAMKRKQAIRQNIGSAYQSMMGKPSAPQDHPANNVVHPNGNRGLDESTLSMFPPLSTPNSGAYMDDY
jgi:hypothetical protein